MELPFVNTLVAIQQPLHGVGFILIGFKILVLDCYLFHEWTDVIEQTSSHLMHVNNDL